MRWTARTSSNGWVNGRGNYEQTTNRAWDTSRVDDGGERTTLFCRPIAHFDEYSPELEKFAELIVKKCANIVRNSSLPDAYSEVCLEYIADELEEHFGVEP
jgi:hypothetical protein